MITTTPATLYLNKAHQSGFFMSSYSKPVLSLSEQIDLLESRGLVVPDKDKARHYLSYIAYYRLSGYTIVFEESANGERNHRFKPGTTFDNIIELYNFDRHLRLLVIDAIERIEVAVRTQICLQMATTYADSHWHLRKKLFSAKFDFDGLIKKCKSEQRMSKESFVKHYKQSYDEPQLVPTWMAGELLSMGTWSTIYTNLEKRSDRKKISSIFKLSPPNFSSWLHAVTYIRNLCAHHSRLWNRRFTLRPAITKEHQNYLSPNDSFAAQAAMLHLLLRVISPDSEWTTNLYKLIRKSNFIDTTMMGFAPGWEKDKFWEVK